MALIASPPPIVPSIFAAPLFAQLAANPSAAL
jgi:hypothetical protein